MTSMQSRPAWADDVDSDKSGIWQVGGERQMSIEAVLGRAIHNFRDILSISLSREWDLLIRPGQPSDAELAAIAGFIVGQSNVTFCAFEFEDDWLVRFQLNGQQLSRKWLSFSASSVVVVPESGEFIVGNQFSDMFFVAACTKKVLTVMGA
jgi:hypothetical protein